MTEKDLELFKMDQGKKRNYRHSKLELV